MNSTRFVLFCICSFSYAQGNTSLLKHVVTQVASQWVPCHFVALVTFDSTLSYDVILTLQTLQPNYPLVITPRITEPSYNSIWPDKVYHLLVLVTSKEEFYFFLDFAQEDDNWNPRAKMVLIVQTSLNEREIIFNLLSFAWSHKYQLYNTVACLLKEDSIVIYTLMKQPQPACDQPALIKVATLTSSHLPHVNFFPRKLSQLGGCPIKVANMNQPPHISFSPTTLEPQGVNGMLLKILSQELNFTIILKPSKQLHEFTDSDVSNIMSDLFNNNIDLMPYPFDLNLADISYAFGWHTLTFVVPESEYLPVWLNLIIPFQPKLWMALIITLLVETFLQILFLPNSFWPAYTSKLNLSSSFKPKKLSSKIFLCNLLASGIVLNTAYLSALYQSLTLPKKYPDINTVHQLLATDLPIVGFKLIEFYVALPNTTISRQLIKRFVVSIESPETELKKLALYRNQTYLYDGLRLKYIQRRLFTEENLQFHIAADLIKFLNCFAFPRGSLYVEDFNYVIKKVLQSGIYFKWEKDVMLDKKYEASTKIMNDIGKLSLTHFTGAFFLLALGYLTSFLALLIEVIMFKLSQLLEILKIWMSY